jgi:hypothetical protein
VACKEGKCDRGKNLCCLDCDEVSFCSYTCEFLDGLLGVMDGVRNKDECEEYIGDI